MVALDEARLHSTSHAILHWGDTAAVTAQSELGLDDDFAHGLDFAARLGLVHVEFGLSRSRLGRLDEFRGERRL